MFLRRFKVTWTTGSTMSYGHILFLCCLVDSRVECSPDVGADIFTFGSQKMEVKTFVSLRPQRCFTYQYSENGVTPATCRYGESSTDGTMARDLFVKSPVWQHVRQRQRDEEVVSSCRLQLSINQLLPVQYRLNKTVYKRWKMLLFLLWRQQQNTLHFLLTIDFKIKVNLSFCLF